ncbi:hypothetical protein HSB1_04660 [Halogranum salarium B-1]|uniref:Uncharacterized protein n=1 Tax=Halogranum salarium B-1 TaxID=1210908 RepID=J2ZL16_9EURY|nr:hypothetical protein HSB1_04660 [Halogranum salarium B-1]
MVVAVDPPDSLVDVAEFGPSKDAHPLRSTLTATTSGTSRRKFMPPGSPQTTKQL